MLVLGVLITVYGITNYMMSGDVPTKPTSLSSQDAPKDRQDVPQDGSSDRHIKPPKDEDEKKDKNPE